MLASKDQLPGLLAHFQLIGVNAFLAFGSQPDSSDAMRNIATVEQAGLGLPEKDYYLRAGDKDKELRAQYVRHVANMLKLLGSSEQDAATDAAAIVKLETALAEAFLARASAEHVDLGKKSPEGYNPVQQLFPGSAQSWCSEWRPELERLIATANPHAPDRFRANGVLVNMPEFGRAFGCKAGQPMPPAKTCRCGRDNGPFPSAREHKRPALPSGREDPPKFNRSMLGSLQEFASRRAHLVSAM